jgi:hypothetical protein
MPQLEPDGLELQTAAAIRQTVGPLIARCISRDRKLTSSLAVLNSWDSFKIELNQMLLYLKREQDLPEEDYDRFLGSLHLVLHLIEGLVDKDILPTDQGRDGLQSVDEVGTPFYMWKYIAGLY